MPTDYDKFGMQNAALVKENLSLKAEVARLKEEARETLSDIEETFGVKTMSCEHTPELGETDCHLCEIEKLKAEVERLKATETRLKMLIGDCLDNNLIAKISIVKGLEAISLGENPPGRR